MWILEIVLSFFLDFAKAFGKVPHGITGQLADRPTRRQSNSLTNQLADNQIRRHPTHRQTNSLTIKRADKPTRQN